MPYKLPPASEFHHYVQIEANQGGADLGNGNKKINWTVIKKTNGAAIEYLGGVEALSMAQMVGGQTIRVTIAYPKSVTITNTMRVLIDGKYYEVQNVQPTDSNKFWLQMMCVYKPEIQ